MSKKTFKRFFSLLFCLIFTSVSFVFASEDKFPIETKSNKTRIVTEEKPSSLSGTIKVIDLDKTGVRVLKAGGAGLVSVVSASLGGKGIFVAAAGFTYICESEINAAKVKITYVGKTKFTYEENMLTKQRTLIKKEEKIKIDVYTGTNGSVNTLSYSNWGYLKLK
ncbi:MAG: hypothetical protein EOM45_02955 [Clostridia bacterium]|nr:hypothetical protein [Clostridia bacterium]